MIEAFGLTSNPRKAHPPAVDDVSFEARAGHVTTLLGAAGAGKTTVLRLVLELQQGRGITYFRGRPLRRIAHPSREVGVLLGDVPGHPARSVRGHLRMLCAAAGVPARRADEVLEVVGLVSLREERLGTLSRGMDRRLGLACALLSDPHTLVLDEPAEGLSAREARWVHGMLRAHASQGGTVLVTTSDPKEASRTADRVVTLDGGRLVADQEAREFARTRLRPRVAVRSPHAARLAALLTKEARTGHRSVEVVREGGNRLSVYGSTTADIGETAFRNGILVHQLADEVGDMGPDAGADQDGGVTPAVREQVLHETSPEGSAPTASVTASDSASVRGARTAARTRPVSTPSAWERGRVSPGFPLVEQKQGASDPGSVDQEASGGERTSVAEPRRHHTVPERHANATTNANANGIPADGATTATSEAGRAAPGVAGPGLEETAADETAAAVDAVDAPDVSDTTGALPAIAQAGAGRPRSTGAAPEAALQATSTASAASAASTTSATPDTQAGPADPTPAPAPTTAPGTPLPGARNPGAHQGDAGRPFVRPAEECGPDALSSLPPPISVRPAPTPLRPLRYELRRATGISTGFLTCGAVLIVSALTAVLLARIGHTPQARLFAAWPRGLPLPPVALAAGLLGALAFGDEFRHPALAADRGTVPRRLGLLTAKLLVSGATALMLAFLALGCDVEALYLVYGRELTEVPADWLSLSASWFGLVVGCAWAGVLAAGVFRSTTAGLAAVLAVPVVVVPLVHRALGGRAVPVAAGLAVRMREVLLLQWPFGGERYLLATARVVAQPVGGAMALSLGTLLCAYVFMRLRTRVR
ncbi:ABC transporter ATP-binding protein [Streptomyces sp. NBC_00820]|uniref:ABC transporter ATP-binding protein n=1 Tax=Streptomyces sp. NBC_00820 TaxID=2975842 RepID=UPI003FA7D467